MKSDLGSCLTYALIDSGASISAIRLDAADFVGAKVTQKESKLVTFGKNETAQRDFASFEIEPIDKTFCIKIKDALVGDILTTEKEKPPKNEVVGNYPFMAGVNFVELEDPTVSVILDVRHAWTWAGGDTKSGSRDEPIALKTRWGWTLLGAQNNEKEKMNMNLESV